MTLDIIPLIIEYARTPIDYPIDAKDEKFDYSGITENDISVGWHGIVIDLGSGSIKAGICGNDAPNKVFPPAVAYDKDNNIVIGNEIEKYEKQNKKLTNKHYVIQNGKIQNFDEMVEILKYIVKDIDDKFLSKEGVFLIPSSEQSSNEYYRKLADQTYDNLNIHGIQMMPQSTCALYACGYISGIAVNCGYGMTQIIPIYEGIRLKDIHMIELEFGKQDLMAKSIINDAECIDYMMNDIKLPELVLDTIVKIWKPTKDENPLILHHILIVGGNCQYKGFKEEFEEKFRKLLNENQDGLVDDGSFRIVCPSDGAIAAWLGGSIMTSLYTFQRNFLPDRCWNDDNDTDNRLWIEMQ